jgi:parallel beta-helix repeat protein
MLEGLEQRWVPSTVTNNNDSGPGSLRAAIASAHNGDTINFDPSLNGQTITLTTGELLIKKSLTISGPGASLLAISGNAISGNNGSRVFDVSTSRSQVILSGLTLENGNGVGGGANSFGGAIENLGTLTVSNCIVTSSSAYAGGGIDNQTGATLTVNNNSTVSNNTSTNNGGGINNNGTLTVSGCTISNNSIKGYGGGIANIGILTVTNSTLSNNLSNGGGGIWTEGSTATVSGCTLSGNTGINGGAIRNDAGSLTLTNCTLSGNTATAGGGGIVVFGGTGTVSDCKLTGNSAALKGGGIWIYPASTVTVQNSSTITGNSAPVGSGADVYNNGVLHVDATSTIGVLDGNPATIPLWAFDRK